MTRSASAMTKISKPLIIPPTRDQRRPHHFPVIRRATNAAAFCLPGGSAGSAGFCCAYRYGEFFECARCTDQERGQVVNPLGENRDLNSPCKSLIRNLAVTRTSLDAIASNPALKLAQHELADHIHAGVAVVQARDCRELLAALVPKNLGILLRDLL